MSWNPGEQRDESVVDSELMMIKDVVQVENGIIVETGPMVPVITKEEVQGKSQVQVGTGLESEEQLKKSQRSPRPDQRSPGTGVSDKTRKNNCYDQ